MVLFCRNVLFAGQGVVGCDGFIAGQGIVGMRDSSFTLFMISSPTYLQRVESILMQ